MTQQQEQIREQQKSSWNKFSAGWKKWDELNMAFLRPIGDAIVASLEPRMAEHVLDVATGTGEPGLTIATKVTGGRVTGFDISEGMIEVARENAAVRGIINYKGMVGDVCDLPFPDNSFDKISCRMGFMFFPDMLLAAKEMFRVLRPGGKLAVSVWSIPENNFWVTAMMGTVRKHVELPPPVPGAPGIFRCASPGFMKDLLQTAGLHDVQQKEIEGEVEYEGPEHYWIVTNEIAAPLAAAMEKTSDEKKMEIKEELFSLLEKYMREDSLALHYEALILTGKK